MLVLMAPLRAYLTIGRMVGWTQSCKEGWRLHLLKRLHCPLKDKGSATPLPLTALAAPATSRSYILGPKVERRGCERRVLDLEEEVNRLRCKGEEDKGCH